MLVICALRATQRESFSRNGAQKNRPSIIPSSTFVVPMMPFNSVERFWAAVTFGSTLPILLDLAETVANSEHLVCIPQ